jgi:hypothetical protein
MTLKNPVIGLNIFDSFFSCRLCCQAQNVDGGMSIGEEDQTRASSSRATLMVGSSAYLVRFSPSPPAATSSLLSCVSYQWHSYQLWPSSIFFFTKYDDYFWDLSLSMSFTWFHLLSWKPAGPNIFSRHDAGTGKEACSLWSCSFYISAPLISYVKL